MVDQQTYKKSAKDRDIAPFDAPIAVGPNWVRIGDLMAVHTVPLSFYGNRPTAPL